MNTHQELAIKAAEIANRHGDSAFIRFWEISNAILAFRGEPEWSYGEARDWWAQHPWQG